MPAHSKNASFAVGEVIAERYKVSKVLSRGGTGEVYAVNDLSLDNQIIALKLLYPHLLRDERVYTRFRNEVLLTRALRHPNIIQMYDLGRDDAGRTFLTMQYSEGASLGRMLRRLTKERLTFKEIAYIICEVLSGLSYTHEAGVVHRDLKPDNLLVSTSADIRIGDFGTARALCRPGATRPGERIGTPLYMSPEQFRGEQVDARTDLYALGLLGFELATGVPPFRGSDVMTVGHKHCSMPIPDMRRANRNLTHWFIEFVRICTAKSPDDRFASAQQALTFIAEQFDAEDSRSEARRRISARIKNTQNSIERQQNSDIQRLKVNSKFKKIPQKYKLGKRRTNRPSSIDSL